MANRGTIAILTGGGDVPGLNPAIRAVTIRAISEGYQVIGIRRGWAGLMELVRDKDADNSDNYHLLEVNEVNKLARTGGTFLHTSRVNPANVKKEDVPEHLKDQYNQEYNDLTDEILKNIDFLGVDYLIPIGGNDALKYALDIYGRGVNVLGIPKTMDNDVFGTDYCIGYSTCVTRTISMANLIRTSAGSHERFMVLEVFGRYSGFTAMLPTLTGAANRCVIPEYQFDIEHLTDLLIQDRIHNPSRYSVVLVSEGATYKGQDELTIADKETDGFGNPKLGGIGDDVAEKIKEYAPKYNNGKRVNVISQRLGYLVRGGDPDSMDSIVPMAYGNMALELIMKGVSGRLTVLKNGRYGNAPLDIINRDKKRVDVRKYYSTERLRPKYKSMEFQPMLVMTGD